MANLQVKKGKITMASMAVLTIQFTTSTSMMTATKLPLVTK